MANQTVTQRYHNVIGNMREDHGVWTSTSADNGEVVTRLHWIEHLDVMSNAQRSAIQVYKNSTTASLTQDDPGTFHYFGDGSTDSTTDATDQVFSYIAYGW